MRRGTLAGLGAGVLLWSAVADLCADISNNPYQEIVLRNAFNLKPPPPPPDPSATNPPPAPVKIVLTGISTLSGTPKVLLEITENAPGKKPEFPPPLVPGDVQGRVEIVSIDADKGEVKVKIDGAERVLTFEKDGAKPGSTAAAPPAVPGGVPRPPGVMPPAVPVPAPAAAATTPSGNYGVLVGGATPVTTPTPAPASTPTLPSATASSYSPSSTAGSIGVAGATTYGATASPTIPPRPLRTGVEIGGVVVGGTDGAATAAQPGTAQAAPRPVMTREEAIAHINEQKRLIKEAEDLGLIPRGKFPPLPPTPGSPSSSGTGTQPPSPPGAPAPPGLPLPPRPR